MDVVEARMRPAHTYRRPGSVTHCAFMPAVSPARSAGDIGGLLVATVPAPSRGAAFLFASESGALAYASETSGATIELLPAPRAAVGSLEYDAASGRVLLTSPDLSLTTLLYSGADDGAFHALPARTAVGGPTPAAVRAWAVVGGGVLAAISADEPSVQLFDLARGSSALLTSAASATGIIPRAERLCAVAYSAAQGVLVAGSEAGRLYVWQRGARAGAWEPVHVTSLAGGGAGDAVVAVHLAARAGGSLAVQLASGALYAIREASLRRKMAGSLTAVQLSAPQ